MRRILLATIASLTLLLAPLAAASDHGRSGDHLPDAAAHADGHENETNESSEHHLNATERHANETAFKEKMATLRESFVQDVKDLVAGCKAQREADRANNTTSHDANRSWANCVSNGMHALQISHHAQMKELRQERRAWREANDG